MSFVLSHLANFRQSTNYTTAHKHTFIDLFAGIGGFRIASESLGGECWGYSEINKDALHYYRLNHDGGINLGDITKITELPSVDILTAGVPCQSWSIAGKKLGFEDDRGQLWNDTIYLLNQSRPKSFVFENVKGLTDPRNKKAFDYIISRIEESGYFVKYKVLNSINYGVKQSRERVFLVGFLEKEHYDKFEFPLPTPIEETEEVEFFSLSDLRNGKNCIHSWELLGLEEKYSSICMTLLKNRRSKKYGTKDGNPISQEDLFLLNPNATQENIDHLVKLEILSEINNKYDFKNRKISSGIKGISRVYLPRAKHFPTLVSSDTNDMIALEDVDSKEDFINKIYKEGKFRKITKEEALDLQGFPRDFILPDKRSRWMKLIGNSVSVPLVKQIIENVINSIK